MLGGNALKLAADAVIERARPFWRHGRAAGRHDGRPAITDRELSLNDDSVERRLLN